LAEPEVTARAANRLLRDAFHQVAVGGEHVGVVVDDAAAEHGAEGWRSAIAMPTAIGEGPGRGGAGGGLDAQGVVAVFRNGRR